MVQKNVLAPDGGKHVFALFPQAAAQLGPPRRKAYPSTQDDRLPKDVSAAIRQSAAHLVNIVGIDFEVLLQDFENCAGMSSFTSSRITSAKRRCQTPSSTDSSRSPASSSWMALSASRVTWKGWASMISIPGNRLRRLATMTCSNHTRYCRAGAFFFLVTPSLATRVTVRAVAGHRHFDPGECQRLLVANQQASSG